MKTAPEAAAAASTGSDAGATMWLDTLGTDIAQRFYDAGGHRTRVIEAGRGEPLVLLHGAGGHAETYQRNFAVLSRHYRVLSVDMLGHGLTDRPDQTYTLDHFADHVVALLDAVGADEVYLSGESLGAMVAGWTAIKHASRVKKLMLNTGILSRPNAAGMAALDDLESRTNDLADLTVDSVRHRMAWLVNDPSRMSEEMVRIRYAIYSQPGMVAWMQKMLGDVLRIIRGVGDVDYLRPGVLAEIKAPTMVLWTDHNPGHDADQVRAHLGEFQCQLEFVVMEGCGHWPQFEDPDGFNELILGFMRP